MRKLTLTLILTLTLTLTTVAPQELGIMRRIDEMEKLEELQGQREQLAVAMQELQPNPNPELDPEAVRVRGRSSMPSLALTLTHAGARPGGAAADLPHTPPQDGAAPAHHAHRKHPPTYPPTHPPLTHRSPTHPRALPSPPLTLLCTLALRCSF